MRLPRITIGLRERFILIITLMAFVVVVLSVTIEVRNHNQELRSEMRNAVNGLGHFAALTAPEALLSYDLLNLDRMVEEISNHKDVIYATILQGGHPLATHINIEQPQTHQLPGAPHSSLGDLLPKLRTMTHMDQLTFPISTEGAPLAELEIGISLLRMDQAAEKIIRQALFKGGALLLGIALLIYLTFEHYVSHPLRAILSGIQRGHSDTAFAPVAVASSDELGQLATAFNLMMSEISANHSELLDREQNLWTITDAVQDGIVRLDSDGQVIFWNRAAESILGYPATAIVGQRFLTAVTPDRFRRQEDQQLQRLIDGEAGAQQSSTLECDLRHLNGDILPIELTLSSLPTPNGWHTVAVVRDIRRRRQAEMDQRLAATAFETNDAIMVTDTKGHILRINRACSRITGYTAAEMVGQNPRMLSSGHQGTEFYQRLWQELLEQGTWHGEVWNRRKNGEIYPEWLSISAVKNHRGITTHYIGIFSDQSHQAAQRRQISLLLDATAEGIIGTDCQGTITFVNQSVRQMLGDGELELIGDDLHSLFIHSGKQCHATNRCALFQSALAGEPVHAIDGLLRSTTLTDLPVEYWMRPIQDHGSTIGVLLTCIDITARIEAQQALQETLATLEIRVEMRTQELQNKMLELEQTREELIQSEKMASLGRLVAGFAHEINTPIGIAVGGASHIEASTGRVTALLDQDEVAIEDLVKALSSVTEASQLTLMSLRRAAKLVQSFKRTAVDQSHATLHQFELCQVIHDVVASLHSAFKHTTIEISAQCDMSLTINSRPGAIEQILTNLLLNSLKHGFNDGDLGGTIEISAQLQGAEVMIHYRDNGQGMDSATRDKIFEPFFTTARGNGGSGLGLFICYNLVTVDLQGSIWCESKLGEGSQFGIRFPVDLDEGPHPLLLQPTR